MDADQPVTDASVHSWQMDGTPITLSHVENGIYSTELAIPFDTPTGSNTITITAQNAAHSFVGEQTLLQNIKPARIQLTLKSPSRQSLVVLQENEFEVHATYANGNPLQGPIVVLAINETQTQLQPSGADTFKLTHSFGESDLGTKTITIRASDSAGNTTEQTFQFFISETLELTALRYLPLALVVLAILAVTYVLVLPKIRGNKQQSSLADEQKETEKELSALQDAYFNKASVSPAEYQKKSTELEKRLAELGKQIKTKKP